MKVKKTSVREITESIVPISRFNRGEANRIFEEVSAYGTKIVLKNNTPACVLVDPDLYEDMIEAIEDYALYFEAEERLRALPDNGHVSFEKAMEQAGILAPELEESDGEID